MVSTDTLYGAELFINKTARTREEIKEVADFLKLQMEHQKDFVVPADKFHLVPTDNGVKAAIDIGGAYGTPLYDIRPLAHNQIGVLAGVPGAYYDRCLTASPPLLCDNVNRWFPASGRTHLVRVMGDHVRAVMSDRYLPLDNFDLFYSCLKVRKEIEGLNIIRVQMSESRFFLAFVNEQWAEDVYQDVTVNGTYTRLQLGKVAPLVTVVNSETGKAGLSVAIGTFEMICLNENVWMNQLARRHIGRSQEVGFVSPETRKLEAELIWATVRDAIRAAFDQDKFTAMVEQMRVGASLIVEEPTKAVEVVAKQFMLSQQEQDDLLNEFTSPTVNVPHGPSILALGQAFSYLATQNEDADRAFDLQQAAGWVIEKGRELVPVRVRS